MAGCSGGDRSETAALSDHTHQAYGVYVCDRWLPPLWDLRGDRVGIHTHQDGLIHVHATAEEAKGDGAVLGLFADEVSVGLQDGVLTVPDGTRYEDGDDCGGAPGSVRVLTWDGTDDRSPEEHRHALDDVRIGEDGGVLAIVFAPEEAEVPQPPSTAQLAHPADLEPSSVG